jgi:hypothetical protein
MKTHPSKTCDFLRLFENIQQTMEKVQNKESGNTLQAFQQDLASS